MASRPSLPNLRSRRTVSRQPRRMTPTTLTLSRIHNQANYGQQGYAAPSYSQSAYTQPAYAQQPAYGQPVAPAGYAQKSKLAAGLLGIFLGCFGVHNFYFGQHRRAGRGTAAADRHRLDSIIGPAVAGIWGLVESILIHAPTTARNGTVTLKASNCRIDDSRTLQTAGRQTRWSDCPALMPIRIVPIRITPIRTILIRLIRMP